MLDRCGTEKEKGVNFGVQDLRDFCLVEIYRSHGAVGDDFDHFRAVFAQNIREIRIGAVAARKKNGLVPEAFAKFVGQRGATMGIRFVVDKEACTLCGFGCCGADGGGARTPSGDVRW